MTTQDGEVESSVSGESVFVSDEWYRTFFHESAIGQTIVVPGKPPLDVNAAFAAMLGYSREELLRMPVSAISHPEDYAQDLELAERLLRGETHGYRHEKRYLHKDGSVKWGLLSVVPISMPGLEPCVLGQVVDVTERKLAEDRLREGEQRLLRAQRIAHVGSWEWDVRTNSITWSEELYRIYGLAPGTPLSFEQFLGLLHPDDRERIHGIVEESFATREPFSFYHRIVRADDGAVRVLRGEGDVMADASGEVVKLLGTGQDVTKMMAVEEELRQSEQRFRLLAENMTDMVMLLDPSAQFIYVSPSSERILGYTPDELSGRSLFDLLHRDDVGPIRDGAYQGMLSGHAYTEALARVGTKHDETVWLEFAAKPIIRDGAVYQILASARDVTSRVRAEEQARRSRANLEARNRELQEFAYVASHDLQEPLRKIRAFADLLEEDCRDGLNPLGEEHLERIKNAAARMSMLISELLSLTRVTTQEAPLQRVELGRELDGVLKDLEVSIKEARAEVVVEPLPVIEADPVQMRRLFQNLISNALKFRREGVAPRIRVRGGIVEKQLPARAAVEDVCLIEVSDNGIGFDPTHRERIFVPFQRLHQDAYDGTGMGLSICRKIVERHDGIILAESVPRVGTTFRIELPAKHTSPGGE